ncbi:unnamed protein product [Urochloa decumbens]|uniref:Uncharacterized protein n=1 Tax=Urochloa decumbens TaxID=240449 RepID=A0ABC8VLN0_9POAL
MSANGMSRVFTPVVQAKGQQGSMNNMQNYSTGDNTSFPVTGASYIGGTFLSGNTIINVPPPQGPSHSTFGIGGDSSF